MDLTLEIIQARDDARPERDGRTVTHEKVVTFYLGKFGPFTERFPPDVDALTINARIDQIKRTLEGIHA